MLLGNDLDVSPSLQEGGLGRNQCGIPDSGHSPIPVGLVGAGRSRNGLGPFLAEFLERAGFVVLGVSGRSPERGAANAAELGRRLGHEVRTFVSPRALCENGIGALIVCSPAEHHLEALHAAAEAGLPTLCEKPFVHENDSEKGAMVIETFVRRHLPLMENCHWPYVLPAFLQLHGAIEIGPEPRVEMGLGPPRTGREMVQNTLSHLLSVIQTLVTADCDAAVKDVHLDNPALQSTENVLRFRLVWPRRTIECVLHLTIHAAPPRPAWLTINGRHMDRRVLEGHSIAFSSNGREAAIDDPMKQLVKRFAVLVQSRDPVLIDFERTLVHQRFRWYREILGKLA